MDNREVLIHYGVLGMRWGVRRTPEQLGHRPKNLKKLPGPEEGATVLKKGTKFQRIATGSNMDFTTGVYSSYKISDMDLYKGVLGRMRVTYMLKNEGDVKLKELSMTAKKDIRLPSMETRLEEFKKLYAQYPDDVKSLIKDHESSRYNRNNNLEFDSNNKRKTKTTYQKFNDALSLGTNSDHGRVIKKYYDNLSKLGYDAIPDENDIRLGTFKAQAPIIMFDTNQTISKIKSRNLTASEVYNAYVRSMPKKTVRGFVELGDIGFEKLKANSDSEMNKYARQLARDKYTLNKNYSLSDLASDWGSNRLSARQIRVVNDKMDEGKTHDEAVSETIALGNAAIDLILNKIGL